MKLGKSILASIAVVGLLSLAACGEDTAADSDTTTSEAGQSAGEGSGAEAEAGAEEEAIDVTGTVDITDTPGSQDGYTGALEDATVDTCDGDGSAVSVAGSITNSGSEDANYRIYVAALDGRETLGVIQVDVDNVPAGASQQWETSLNASGDDVRCVLRVERVAS